MYSIYLPALRKIYSLIILSIVEGYKRIRRCEAVSEVILNYSSFYQQARQAGTHPPALLDVALAHTPFDRPALRDGLTMLAARKSKFPRYAGGFSVCMLLPKGRT